MRVAKVLIFVAALLMSYSSYAELPSFEGIKLNKDTDNEQLLFESKSLGDFSVAFSSISVLSDFPNSYVRLLDAIKKEIIFMCYLMFFFHHVLLVRLEGVVLAKNTISYG